MPQGTINGLTHLDLVSCSETEVVKIQTLAHVPTIDHRGQDYMLTACACSRNGNIAS